MSNLPRVLLLPLGLSLLLVSGRSLHAQSAADHEQAHPTRYGVGFGAAVSTSPLGEIAERHGTYGIPGYQYEVRFFARTLARGEWSVALLWDDYHVGQRLDLNTKYAFDYDSRTVGHAAVLGWTAGLEIPGRALTTVPRIRLEMNFPDFGGGDGYTLIHPETDLGFKASFGVTLKLARPF